MVRQRSRPGYMTRARALSLLQRARTKVIATLTVGCPAAWAISGWSSKPTFSQLTAVLLACVLTVGLYATAQKARSAKKKSSECYVA